MKITISHSDAASDVVLNVAVNGQPWGELEPGKTITVTGVQIALSYGHTIEKEEE